MSTSFKAKCSVNNFSYPIRTSLICFCFLLLFNSVHSVLAQSTLQLFPIQQESTQSKTKRKAEVRSIKLPFWDDFSFAGKPADTLWASKEDVRITDGMAIRPPSVGVAVFDGINREGVAYSNDLTANGFTDSLVSRPIRLDLVPIANRDSVYLSFYYQWKGNGEAPDPADYLQVDFKDETDSWIPISLLRAPANPDASVFIDYLERISDNAFFHDDFQFRIVRYGRQSGPFDTWLVDYVYLNEHRFALDSSFPDRSISSPLTSLFNDYYAVPKNHFLVSKEVTAPSYVIATQKNSPTPLDQFTYLEASNYSANTTASYNSTLDNAVSLFLPAFGKVTEQLQLLPDVNNAQVIDPLADSTTLKLKLIITSNDNLSIFQLPKPVNADYNDFIYSPINFRANDTTQTTYTLSNYYAYDDGKAEYSAGLTQPGNRAAMRFTLIHNEADTLTGVYIYFPRLTGTLSNIVNLQFYADASGLPGSLLGEEVVTIQRLGLDQFHKIILRNSILLPSVFHIGWEQPVNGNVSIGLDRSRSNPGIFSNGNGTWINVLNVQGTLMIRPIFAKGTIVVSVEKNEETLKIYPNPLQTSFTINQAADVVDITSINGVPISFHSNKQDKQTIVDLTTSIKGLILIRIRINNSLFIRKAIIE